MGEPIVQACNLTKRYGKNRGITNVSLGISPGEIFGFLGPNGAGKTTTLRILLDMIRPSSGSASLFGLDAHRESLRIRRRVGYLPGEFTLYGHLTGRQMLEYFASLRGGVDWSYVLQLSERLGSDLSRPMGQLSHGNKQKVGLIQAAMNRPELLILDEPTTGLDPLVQQEFFHLLDEVRSGGGTVFLSSHVLPEVERACDRVAIIRDGVLVSVEDVSAIKNIAVRRIEVTFNSPVPDCIFERLDLHNLALTGNTMRCTVQGSIDPLIKALSRHDVTDFISREPNLEETFLAMYGEGTDAQ